MEDDDPEVFILKITDGMSSYLDPAYLPHVLAVLNSVPGAALKKLAKSDAALFAIDPNRSGQVLDPRFFFGPIVYLSPKLLLLPEDEITGTIAHEFAEVVLHLDKRAESGDKTAYELAKSDEEAADKVAESWGFKLRSLTRIGYRQPP
jgi:hypothetical protein